VKRLAVVVSVLLAILLIASLVVSCTPKPQETVILRLPMAQPPQDPFVLLYQDMADQFNARANGEYQIEIYPGGSLIAIPEAFDAVRTGAAEMGSIGMGMYSGADNRLYGTELPFLYNNIQALAAGQTPEFAKLVNDEILVEKFNQMALTTHHSEFPELISTRPVRTLEDWNGLLVGAISPGIAPFTRELGGSSVTQSWADTYSNLEKGVIDASLEATTWMLIAGMPDVAKYVTYTSAISTSYAITINMDIWNAMPKRIQDILTEEALKEAVILNEHYINNYENNKAAFAALGVEVYVLPKAERDKWSEVLRPYVEEQLASMGAFGAGLKQVADKANAEYP